MVSIRSVLILLVPSVSAWDGEGHRIIAQIAGSLMTPKTSRYIREHLMEVPRVSKRRSMEALVDASTWADQVADNGELPWSSDLHFSHTPYRDCQQFDFDRDCGFDGSGRCLVSGISNYTARAADITLPLSERADAIKFLIHFVADAHQGLHVGFARDFGGNAISLAHPAEYNLHGSWDSYLLREYKSSLPDDTDASWYGIASLLTREVDNIDVKNSLRIPIAGTDAGMDFAARIVSDTAMNVTCQYAYVHGTSRGGEWIENGDSLSAEYIRSRGLVMVEQFKKAGVRLAQLLDSVATAYYRAERENAPMTVAGAGADPTTRFPWEFDPEDFVYELDDEDVEMETIVSAGAGSSITADSTLCSPATTTTPLPRSPAERKRLKRQKDKARMAKQKRLVFGLDLDEMVLVKQRGRFVVTYKSLAKSGDWFPPLFVNIEVAFGTGSGHVVAFVLDGDVFDLSTSIPPNAILRAVFAKLAGASDDAPFPTRTDDLEASMAMGGPVLDPKVLASAHKLCEMQRATGRNVGVNPLGLKTEDIEFSHISGILKPKATAAELRLQYGGRIPSEDERITDLFMAQANQIVSFNFKGLLLVSRYDLLMDRSITRWVFNKHLTSDTYSTGELRTMETYVDARFLDEPFSEGILDRFHVINGRVGNRALVRKVHKAMPPILETMMYIGYGQSDPTANVNWVVLVKSLNTVIRPDRTTTRTIQIVLRTPEEIKLYKRSVGFGALHPEE